MGGGVTYSDAIPEYVKTAHETLIDDMMVEYPIARDANPYAGAYTFNPSTDFTALLDRFEAFDDLRATIDPEDNITSFVAKAVGLVDDVIAPGAGGTAVVNEYAAATRQEFARSINRFTGPMDDIGASVGSSAFIMGMALLEAQHLSELHRTQREITLQETRARTLAILQAAQDMSRVWLQRMDMERGALMLYSDVIRQKILAMTEYLNNDLNLDVREKMWKMETISGGGSILSAISGVPVLHKEPSRISSALGGFISTAGTVGAAAAPLGPAALPLALLAGIFGGVSGYLR